MDQLTLYVAGPMTGLPEFNYPAFHDAADRLRAVGFAVVHTAVHEDTTQPWEFYLRYALKRMLDCDAVATLDGWPKAPRSRGTALEVHVAEALGMPVRTVDQWVGVR